MVSEGGKATQTDLRESMERCLELIQDLREAREDVRNRNPFDVLGLPFYLKVRHRYWGLSIDLEIKLQRVQGVLEGWEGLDRVRFERNFERLLPQLGGWRLASDTNLATMAATLRSALY